MSLKAFHVVFISASVLLAFGFAAWCLGGESAVGPGRAAAAVAATGIGAALALYELWFVRKMRSLS